MRKIICKLYDVIKPSYADGVFNIGIRPVVTLTSDVTGRVGDTIEI